MVAHYPAAPTFQALGGVPGSIHCGLTSPGDAAARRAGTNWRTTALVDHHGPDTDLTDPDLPDANRGNPLSYGAIRTGHTGAAHWTAGHVTG